MRTDILGKTRQSAAELTGEGDSEQLRMTRLGQMLTVGGREALTAAGKCWIINVGDLTDSGDVLKYSGGGFGTTITNDEPEIAIGVDENYYMIPLEIMVGASAVVETDADVAHILAIGDRAATVPTCTCQAVGGLQVPVNLLDGGGTFPGIAYTLVSTAIADPTVSEILDFETIILQSDATSGVGNLAYLKMEYEPKSPSILKGPCSIYVYWGGTDIVMAMARVVVAIVPIDWLG